MKKTFVLKSLYIRTFKHKHYQECFILKKIFQTNSLTLLQWFETFFVSVFDEKFYNYLFEAAVYKKNLQFIDYLVVKTNFNLPQEKKLLNDVQSQLLTNHLKEKDYFSWLAIIASHSNLQLLGLEKKYSYEENFNIISYLFTHTKLKCHFNNEVTKMLVLNHCHDNAKKMFETLFLQLKISNKKALQDVVPYKVKKI